MWNVKPGDLVVYVGGPPQTSRLKGIPLFCPITVGEIYTVLDVFEWRGVVYASVEERPHAWPDGHPIGWWIQCFRPVAKPSIENLRKLTTKPDLVKEDA